MPKSLGWCKTDYCWIRDRLLTHFVLKAFLKFAKRIFATPLVFPYNWRVYSVKNGHNGLPIFLLAFEYVHQLVQTLNRRSIVSKKQIIIITEIEDSSITFSKLGWEFVATFEFVSIHETEDMLLSWSVIRTAWKLLADVLSSLLKLRNTSYLLSLGDSGWWWKWKETKKAWHQRRNSPFKQNN